MNRIVSQAGHDRNGPLKDFFFHWHVQAFLPAVVFLVVSCVGSGEPHRIGADPTIRGFQEAGGTAASAVSQEGPEALQGGAHRSSRTSPTPADVSAPTDIAASETQASGPGEEHASAGGASPDARRVSLRPLNNVDAEDLLDHWGHRRLGQASALLSPSPEPDADTVAFRNMLDTVRRVDGNPAPGLHDEDDITVLGQHRGLTYGRWTGGPADTLSIDFNLDNAPKTMREDRVFGAMLERAGKVWSRRIGDTWTAWERRYGESKGRLIGNYGADGREIRVGPGGETSAGVEVFITGADLAGNTAGQGGPTSLRPEKDWEPHAGAIAFDIDHVEKSGEADLFHTMVHEIGHVIGAWYGADRYLNYRPEIDREAGTWTGPHVVAVHGGPAPFQDADDAWGWHDGERKSDGSRFDYYHSGVCASVMAYCAHSAAIPAFLPAEIDFAFLADIGLEIQPEADRPETYGIAGWMEHAAFTLSVSRELEVSLADPQPRYSIYGARWTALETVDLLWADADAFGNPSPGSPARTFAVDGTVNYAGGLIGTAVDHAGMPPVFGDAHLSLNLESLTGKASFTSLRMSHNGDRYMFGEGSLHYPIGLAANEIRHVAPGVSLAAGFYGPRHEEVAGTLDDSRAGLLASFGARHDERPARFDIVADAGHVRGMMLGSSSGIGDGAFGWHRLRCGAGPGCESQHHWWGPGHEWRDVAPVGDLSPRERVLELTAGWGKWLSADLVADRGAIRIEHRYAGLTDGQRGRYGEDGYFGTMKHAAFGTEFHSYDNWAGEDGELWSSYLQGAGFQGDLSGSRPPGNAVWEGLMVGYQSGLEAGENPFVQGDARVSLSLISNDIDIAFTGVMSMDLARSLESFGFPAIPLEADGTFAGHFHGFVEGAFFGPAHEEVAGMFQKNANNVIGSFGAVRE